MVIKIEIWSDVACPFCYIGKRKFEAALAQFEHKNKVEVEWKSFMLDPNKITDPSMPLAESLAKRKGISVEQAKEMGTYVTEVAQEVDLQYDFSKTIVANTFNAHRFLHFSKNNNVQNEAKERLLKAYFIDGKNIDDTPTLIQLGTEIGLNAKEVKTMLDSEQYANEVKSDITEAREIGVKGVPFFVFDRKYAVSGAQDPSVFLQTLEKMVIES